MRGGVWVQFGGLVWGGVRGVVGGEGWLGVGGDVGYGDVNQE